MGRGRSTMMVATKAKERYFKEGVEVLDGAEGIY